LGQFNFPHSEKLKHRKRIEQLFAEGISFAQHPIRIVYVTDTAPKPGIQAAFSVSKKKFKTAVARNRIKRLMREGFRLEVAPLREFIQKSDTSIYAMFIYTGNEDPKFTSVRKAFLKTFQKLIQDLSIET
jgi:ribonuclease P protein component